MTKSERQLMDVLWSSDEPLTCAELVEKSENKDWKDSYVHIMVKSLLKKELIKIVGFELNGRSYARKFAPTMTRDESIVRKLIGEEVWSKDCIPPMFATFVANDADLETLDKFNELINARKTQLLEDKG